MTMLGNILCPLPPPPYTRHENCCRWPKGKLICVLCEARPHAY